MMPQSGPQTRCASCSILPMGRTGANLKDLACLKFKRLSNLAFTLAILGLLPSCLEKSLPPKTYSDGGATLGLSATPPNTDGSVENPQMASEAIDLIEHAFDSENKSNEEEIIERLTNSKEKIIFPLSQIRDVQKRFIENQNLIVPWLSQNTVPQAEWIKAQKKRVDLRVKNCGFPKNEIREISNGLRLATSLYRKVKDPCFFFYSKRFEEILNQILLFRSVQVVTGSKGAVIELTTFEQFQDWLQARSWDLQISYRVYLTPFFKLYKKEGDLYEAGTEIPAPLWIDPELKLEARKSVAVPATHSEVVFKFRGPKKRTAELKIYFGDMGFVFDDNEMHLPQWVGDRTLKVFSEAENKLIFKAIPAIHNGFESFLKQFPQRPALSGFGILGVCNDGAALLARAAAGNNVPLPFPLLRSDLVDLPADLPLLDVWRSILADSSADALNQDAGERLMGLGSRILDTTPFIQPSPLKDYNASLKSLREALGRPE